MTDITEIQARLAAFDALTPKEFYEVARYEQGERVDIGPKASQEFSQCAVDDVRWLLDRLTIAKQELVDCEMALEASRAARSFRLRAF